MEIHKCDDFSDKSSVSEDVETKTDELISKLADAIIENHGPEVSFKLASVITEKVLADVNKAITDPG